MDYGVSLDSYKNQKVGLFGGKFFPPHNGHISAILEAAKHVDVLFVAVQFDEAHERALIEGTTFTYVEPRIRERWLSHFFKDMPNIRVLSHYEKRQDDWTSKPETLKSIYKELVSLIGGKVDEVFSCVDEYDKYFDMMLPGTPHTVIYENTDFPVDISATRIRADNIFNSWDFLPLPVKQHYAKKIALCGIESTGKSYLSKRVSQQLRLSLVEEYGREYFDVHVGGYSDVDIPSDYINIAVGHSSRTFETAASTDMKAIIVDTDMIYTQFFYLNSYNELNPTLDMMIKAEADHITDRIFIMPHNAHELDGTRLPISDKERVANNDKLIGLYEHYGKELNIVDEADPVKRVIAVEETVLNLLK